jgi:hypothetical protein
MPELKSNRTLKIKTKIKKPPKELLREEETLLEWEAPSRPFKRRGKEYFTTIGAIVVLLIMICAFLRELLLIGVVLAFAFVLYVLATIPPGKVKNKITTKGIVSAGHTYSWDKLTLFWFSEAYEQKILNLKTSLGFPGQVLLLLGKTEEDRVKKTLSAYLKFEKGPPLSFLDNAAQFLARSFFLEKG